MQDAIQRFPTVARLWKCLTEVHEAKDNLNEAERIFKEASEKLPSFVHRWAVLESVRPTSDTGQSIAFRAPLINEVLSTRTVWLCIREDPPQLSTRPTISANVWAVLICSFAKAQLEERLRGRSQSGEVWGDIHELVNQWGTIEYQSHRCVCDEFTSLSRFLFQGETKMFDEDLGKLGITN